VLIMKRRAGESFVIGEEIEIEILEVAGSRVKLGIVAPDSVVIVRKEAKVTREENITAARPMEPAAITALVVAVLWFRDASFGIRNAALVLGTCLATPYLQDYDLVISALVVAWLMRDASIPATLERPVFYASALLLLLPLIAASLGMLTGLGFGPLFIIPAFAIVARAGFRPAATPARTVAPAMP